MTYLMKICWFYHKSLERHSAQLDISLMAEVGVSGDGGASARNVNVWNYSPNHLLVGY